jgi:hypothetical protein
MGKTQSEIAKLLRVDDQTVAQWEKKKCKIHGPADLILRVLFLPDLPKRDLWIHVQERRRPPHLGMPSISSAEKWLAVSCGNQLRTRKARSAVQLENRLRRIPGGDWRAGGFSALQVAGAMAKGEG